MEITNQAILRTFKMHIILYWMLQPGTKVMILPHVKDEELPKLFPKGVDKVSMPSGKSYVRTTTDY
jgi:hypothetical protein